jgi:hypothetical protein
MRFTRVRLVMATAIVLGLATAAAVVASGATDFGLKQEHRLNAQANQLFGGIGKPLGATAAQASGTEGAASVKLASDVSQGQGGGGGGRGGGEP